MPVAGRGGETGSYGGNLPGQMGACSDIGRQPEPLSNYFRNLVFASRIFNIAVSFISAQFSQRQQTSKLRWETKLDCSTPSIRAGSISGLVEILSQSLNLKVLTFPLQLQNCD